MLSLFWVLVITIAGAIYIISPIDLIPDFIPVIGWIDDMLVAFIILLTWAFYLSSQILKLVFNPVVLIGITLILIFVFKDKIKKFLKKIKK